jgi:hypothetical protein
VREEENNRVLVRRTFFASVQIESLGPKVELAQISKAAALREKKPIRYQGCLGSIFGADDRIRTGDLLFTKQLLYH